MLSPLLVHHFLLAMDLYCLTLNIPSGYIYILNLSKPQLILSFLNRVLTVSGDYLVFFYDYTSFFLQHFRALWKRFPPPLHFSFLWECLWLFIQYLTLHNFPCSLDTFCHSGFQVKGFKWPSFRIHKNTLIWSSPSLASPLLDIWVPITW